MTTSTELASVLRRQFDVSWALMQYHLRDLTTEECLWRPSQVGLHVWPTPGGGWRADWPDHEDYTLGPSSIAWLTWHLQYWWSTVLDRHAGEGTLTRAQVVWPGTAEGVLDAVGRLCKRWLALLDTLEPHDLSSSARWPFTDRPLTDVVAWANLELMKSAADIGSVRFHYAVQDASEARGA